MEVCARPQAWLSIDPNDNDLRIFVRYIVEAVHTLSPTACRRTQALLDTANLPPLSVLATTLINELDSVAQEFILVLDDFHLIKSESVLDLIINLLR
jgi:LuxR family maltose regulon positive regulatory protein